MRHLIGVITLWVLVCVLFLMGIKAVDMHQKQGFDLLPYVYIFGDWYKIPFVPVGDNYSISIGRGWLHEWDSGEDYIIASEIIIDDTIPIELSDNAYLEWHDSALDSTYEIMFDEEYSVFEMEYKGVTYIVDLENVSIRVKDDH